MKIQNYLSNSPKLEKIIKQAEYLTGLNQILEQILTPALAKNCHAVSFNKGLLVLETDNATKATWIRHSEQMLLQALKAHSVFQNIIKIQCKIRPQLYFANKKSTKKLPLSEHSANMIKNTAEYIKDKRLRAALERLSKRACGD